MISLQPFNQYTFYIIIIIIINQSFLVPLTTVTSGQT